MRIPKSILIALVVLAGVVLAALILLPLLRPHVFHGQVLQSQVPVDFTLTAHTGERVALSDFRGKHAVIYFGYTYCPDVCPTTLARLNQALMLLGDRAGDVQVLMVSVDPERDTPEKLAPYMAAFNPTFLGLTGSEQELLQAATPFGVYFAKHEVEGQSGYLVDHTASTMVVDPEGRVKLIWPPNTSAQFMAEDLATMTN
jgi:protein SCO1/2